MASFVGCCCVLPSPFAWCCLASLPFGGAAFSPSAVWVLLCLLLLRFSSPSSWCCLPSPPSLSEAAFSPSSVWWCFISSPSSLGGAAFSPSSAGRCGLTFSFFGWCFGWCYFSLLFCWVVLLGLLRWVVLRLGGATFLLSLLVVLLSLSSSLGWCCLASFVERCCVVPSPFAWCRLPFPPSLGGAGFSPLFCWVVLSTFSSFRWGCFPSLFCWLVLPSFPLLLRVGHLLSPSSVGWCCFASSTFGAAFPLLFSWVVLLGLLRWVVLRYSLSFCVVLPSFPTFFGRVSFKKKNSKNRKNEVKNKK